VVLHLEPFLKDLSKHARVYYATGQMAPGGAGRKIALYLVAGTLVQAAGTHSQRVGTVS